VPRSTWSSRRDVWWAHVAAALATAIGVFAAAGAAGAAAVAEVAAATVVTVAGFEVKARWPGLPSLVLAVWTCVPAVVVNLRGDSEGSLFLVVVGAGFVALTEVDRRTRLAVGVVAVATPALIAVVIERPFSWPFWMIGIAFGWLSGEQMRRFRALVAELEATRERLAVQAVHVERRRIAADLHDLVGHSLTVVLLYLTGARRQLEDDPAAAAGALREAEEIGRASLAEIRRNVAALRDSDGGGDTAPTPGAADLEAIVDGFSAAGSPVGLQVEGDLATVEDIVGLVVYRVVQESLNNAARHAPGAVVAVTVAVAPGAVAVSVVNGGPVAVGGRAVAGGGPVVAGGGPVVAGGGSGGGPGVGLIGMRERVEAVGGTLHAGPDGDGWAVRAQVPRLAMVPRGADDGRS
jgi:signal transduction histidine kinase